MHDQERRELSLLRAIRRSFVSIRRVVEVGLDRRGGATESIGRSERSTNLRPRGSGAPVRPRDDARPHGRTLPKVDLRPCLPGTANGDVGPAVDVDRLRVCQEIVGVGIEPRRRGDGKSNDLAAGPGHSRRFGIRRAKEVFAYRGRSLAAVRPSRERNLRQAAVLDYRDNAGVVASVGVVAVVDGACRWALRGVACWRLAC